MRQKKRPMKLLLLVSSACTLGVAERRGRFLSPPQPPGATGHSIAFISGSSLRPSHTVDSSRRKRKLHFRKRPEEEAYARAERDKKEGVIRISSGEEKDEEGESALRFPSSLGDGRRSLLRWLRGITNPRNLRGTLTKGDVVVPVIGPRDGWSDVRQNMFTQGAYPGVEYRVLDIILSSKGKGEKVLQSVQDAPEGALAKGEVLLSIQPVYPLISRLEREWPVRIVARDVPFFLSPFSYNAATVYAAVSFSATLGLLGAALSQAITFSYIPSHSMEPSLLVGDVVIVEKVSRSLVLRPNDIVFFQPPEELKNVVASIGSTTGPSATAASSSSSSSLSSSSSSSPSPSSPSSSSSSSSSPSRGLGDRDLFVKRVRAVSGSDYSIDSGGHVSVGGKEITKPAGVDDKLPGALITRIRPVEDGTVPADSVLVLGDNPLVSVDSRVWGLLPKGNVVGHPLLRVYPLQRFGPIK